ncbi:MAG TPA: type I-U CRISPR-associated protein Csx17 [Dissulfurispiraceae bacterium]|nr:type I-U CRISPR-associated protein Csx17 [Dissulfurispiraceae bacterium]
MIHIHNLNGCAPVPLAHYLKALGILRLVAEQADLQARGWWEGERFRLATKLNREELEAFFLVKYEPTPMVAPWNKGSGFFYHNDRGLTQISNSTAPRFASFRNGIAASKALLSELTKADEAVRVIKAETKVKGLTKTQKDALKNSPEYKKRLTAAEKAFKCLKVEFIPRCRLLWRGPHREWMDAAMVLDNEGTPSFPALIGTGGNDGRLDFTNNFMQRLSEIFDLADKRGKSRPPAAQWFAGALWGGAFTGCQTGSAVGQYLPGMAGGANSTTGSSGDSQLNPADFILMLEGAVLFTSHATRRLLSTASSRASAPFAVSAQGAGYSSSSDTDESARGEQWMPLWSQPINLYELKRIVSEGRAQIGTQSSHGEPLDLARAVARLGTARGIGEFQRYGYIERNGQSNLAVPLGRFRVPKRVSPHLACLDDLDRYRWLHRLRLEARDTTNKKAPARLKNAEHCLGNALFAVTQRHDSPVEWQNVLMALAKVEDVMTTGSGFNAGPIPPLRPEWVRAADDGSAELRLALAFAMQAASFGRKGEQSWPIDGIRRHWLPLKGNQFAKTGTGTQSRLEKKTEVVLRGRNSADAAISLVQRRLIEASQEGQRRLPLSAAYKSAATSSDLARLLTGEVDLDRTLLLARALMALNSRQWGATPCPPARGQEYDYPDDAWLAIRLAMLPWPLPDGRTIAVDPAIFRRLISGDATAAFELACRRLRAVGITTTVQCAVVPQVTARLWAAALAFPIAQTTAADFVRRLDPNTI